MEAKLLHCERAIELYVKNLCVCSSAIKILPDRESNPGRLGENQES